ncbi:juvenile hormone esterase-like [Zerene cesonia]|uniref:juvenile hormone esterase-like n=1 Tax=Zerene cesonia TaxID=33412 RepID=UPI0018E536AE|nr:juvenile hormone esterase-like [Zerene cesonia]
MLPRISVLLAILNTVTTFFFNNSCIVQTSSGLVKGTVREYNGLHFYSFQGIPYAESPTGEKRFAPPIPKKPWTHIFDATHEGPVCPQKNTVYHASLMNEDCLFINIYVPANRKNKLMPTLVNIHGGAYSILSGNIDFIYGPQFLLQKDIVYVSMNFRLHAFGFLSLDNKEAAGNNAVKDIILSLQWVKRNIMYFGGNNKQVTLIGNSSGAALVHLLMFSKKSTGLFHQAILLSGTTLGRRLFSKYPKHIASLLVQELNIKANNSRDLVHKLKETDTFDIVDAYTRMKDADHNILRTYSTLAPCVEINSTDAVITVDPTKALDDGLPQNVRILTGFNTNEGLYMLPHIEENYEELDNLIKKPETLIPPNIEYPRGSRKAKKLADSISEFYFGKAKRSGNDSSISHLQCLIEYITDVQYIYSTEYWVKKHKARNDSKELFLYEFAFDGQLNWAKCNYGINVSGVAHADELGYLFLTKCTKPYFDNGIIDKRTERMWRTMQDLFSNFIKYG